MYAAQRQYNDELISRHAPNSYSLDNKPRKSRMRLVYSAPTQNIVTDHDEIIESDR